MDTITFKGEPLTLTGRFLQIGAGAPNFKVISSDLKEYGLSDFKDKIKVLTSFPSIDTPVCDSQVKKFNKTAVELSEKGVAVSGISKDLPFAQKRFCEAFEIKNIKLFSDYKTDSFGINYGLLIKETNLLARSVIILDKGNIIRYMQISPELSKSLDYESALTTLEEIIKNPVITPARNVSSRCKPCERGVPSISKEKIAEFIAQCPGWELVENKKLIKELKFKDFIGAKYFLDLLSVIAETEGHHPTMTIIYNRLKITLTTHSSGGLTENDFIMASIIDQVNS